MKNLMLTVLMMIIVGVGGFTAGKNAQTNTGPQVVILSETAQPGVVLAKSGTPERKQALSQNEGCQVNQNEGYSQQKTDERDITMKGLVF